MLVAHVHMLVGFTKTQSEQAAASSRNTCPSVLGTDDPTLLEPPAELAGVRRQSCHTMISDA